LIIASLRDAPDHTVHLSYVSKSVSPRYLFQKLPEPLPEEVPRFGGTTYPGAFSLGLPAGFRHLRIQNACAIRLRDSAQRIYVSLDSSCARQRASYYYGMGEAAVRKAEREFQAKRVLECARKGVGIRAIRARTGASTQTIRAICERFGVSVNTEGDYLSRDDMKQARAIFQPGTFEARRRWTKK
jgi:hypothetical protein